MFKGPGQKLSEAAVVITRAQTLVVGVLQSIENYAGLCRWAASFDPQQGTASGRVDLLGFVGKGCEAFAAEGVESCDVQHRAQLSRAAIGQLLRINFRPRNDYASKQKQGSCATAHGAKRDWRRERLHSQNQYHQQVIKVYERHHVRVWQGSLS